MKQVMKQVILLYLRLHEIAAWCLLIKSVRQGFYDEHLIPLRKKVEEFFKGQGK